MDADLGKRLLDKQAFYAELDVTLADSDDEPDPGRKASERILRKKSTIATAPPTVIAEGSGLARSTSDTSLARHSPQKTVAQNLVRPTTSAAPAARDHAPPLRKGATFSASASEPIVTAVSLGVIPKTSIGKRKRDGVVKLVSEAQQIFKGLHFYFFPNNDNNPARAMRMMKALEYGATWQKDWSEHVTHVVVDKQLDYAMVLKEVKAAALPEHVIVVSENYPADCISFRLMMDPKQKRFQVKGYIAQAQAPATTPVAPVLPEKTSLELKPAGRAVMARPPESPRTTDEASQPPDLPSNESSNAARPVSTKTAAPDQIVPDTTAEFDDAIRQAKGLKHVPFEDEGEDSRPSTSEGPATDDEDQASNPNRKQRTKQLAFQDKFQCMQKHTGDKIGNPNAATITILQQMADYYGQVGDQWRIRAYRKAIATLRNHHTKVWTKKQALALPQIGERLAAKIEEIAVTNRLLRLDNAKVEPSDQVLQTFMGVYGAGFAKASEWVAQGHRTLDEVLASGNLTESQRIGIEHYEDFNSRVPRHEVEQHGAFVRQALHKIDPAFEVIVGGSYRRGSQTSGDIDCILTRPNTNASHLRTVISGQLIPTLQAQGFLVASLATTSRDDGSKWHGASCLPTSQNKIWRRIDLLLVPSDQIGAALIYFTGNDIFNRSLRLLASTKGMRLNQRGLFRDCMREKGREKISEGVLVEGEDERKIFDVLGVPWRPPEHRIC
ncbi:hypothetical protein LTR78_007585 [Recurvomyces mirabilis]|uniref:DNA polymerase lambda n=1 Tax=Recurvomyces mirabilis TaxID=574656 RepID=A0AAE0TRN0_9PEZI|nr:hypothetical protein LTR78_007585 [Recurvomyces mirabilis]KAK5159903.1 hypothetical protein LTS14_002009 [Recurvomyces mirabilis]